jgi:hemolysin D
VSEGARVTAGQVLMRLDTTLSDADRNIVAKEVESRRLQLRRIDAELKDASMKRTANDGSLFLEVDAQARARIQAYRDGLGTEQATLAQSQAELEAGQQQLVKLEKLVPSYREEEAALARLVEQGHVSRLQFTQKQRERIQTEQDLLSQGKTVSSLQARIAQSQTRFARLTSEYRQQLLNERVDAQAALSKAEQELAKQAHRSELSELRAPQDGVVKDIATSTVGAVVTAGTVLATLVPVDEKLRAEVSIKNEDVGFTRPGQVVKIKLAAFPFQKYGMLQGVVERVAADASDQNQPSANGMAEDAGLATYKVIVALQDQQLRLDSATFPMSPGMRVVAEIKQGERTVLEYLLSPVQKVIGEAGRER